MLRKWREVCLIDDGRFIRYVANGIGVSYETLREAINRFRETGSYGRSLGSRETEPREHLFFSLCFLRKRQLQEIKDE